MRFGVFVRTKLGGLLNVLSSQIHRRNWSDCHHSTGTADPSQGYSLSGTRAAPRKRGSGRHNLRQDACGLNLHNLPSMFMQAWCCPSSKLPLPSCLFPERIHLQQPFSLGLSLLLKKVAGGSGWLCPTPTLAPRPQRREGAEYAFILFHVWNHVYCSPESKHFAKWMHVYPPGLTKPNSKSLFTGGQHQSLVASPQLGPVCLLCHPVHSFP